MTFYQPREDSYFLKEFIESLELKDKKFLDMGTGSGIQAVTAAEKGAEVTAADINPEALEKTEENAEKKGLTGIEFIKSDLFQNIEGEFDVIVFNPPYLPGERENKEDPLVGGEKGTEIIERFLADVEEYLKPQGNAYLVASDRADLDRLEDRFEFEVVDSEELWFEKLYILKI